MIHTLDFTGDQHYSSYSLHVHRSLFVAVELNHEQHICIAERHHLWRFLVISMHTSHVTCYREHWPVINVISVTLLTHYSWWPLPLSRVSRVSRYPHAVSAEESLMRGLCSLDAEWFPSWLSEEKLFVTSYIYEHNLVTCLTPCRSVSCHTAGILQAISVSVRILSPVLQSPVVGWADKLIALQNTNDL